MSVKSKQKYVCGHWRSLGGPWWGWAGAQGKMQHFDGSDHDFEAREQAPPATVKNHGLGEQHSWAWEGHRGRPEGVGSVCASLCQVRKWQACLHVNLAIDPHSPWAQALPSSLTGHFPEVSMVWWPQSRLDLLVTPLAAIVC